MASKPDVDTSQNIANDTQQGTLKDDKSTSARETAKGKKVIDLVDKLQTAGSAANATATNTREPATNSRDASPIRPPRSSSHIPQLSRSRRNSQELSPTRSNQSGMTPSIPSAAAVQRALLAPRTTNLPAVDDVLEGARSDKMSKYSQSSLAWPTSPRLRSPPPSTVATRRKPESEQVGHPPFKRLASAPEQNSIPVIRNVSDDRLPPASGTRTPTSRGASTHTALETVEEMSIPNTPASGSLLHSDTSARADLPQLHDVKPLTQQQQQLKPLSKEIQQQASAQNVANDKAESDGKPRIGTAPVTRPGNNLARRSFTSLTGTKTKAGVEPLRTMTVETETVSSMPPITGERGTSGRDGGGSVRTKPSNETIRPKKERKRPARKHPSLHAGTATSKADIFEAKIASAVDEADSSDSEETFVYESNPPDMRHNRHHSRTPSVTSLTSQNDQQGFRAKPGLRSGSQAVTGKKSMKFSSAQTHADGENGSDSARAHGRNNSSTPRHHHIGRYNRAGHPSILDSDSPFTQANRPSSPRTSLGNLVKTSRPNSPRTANGRFPGTPRKSDLYQYDVYDDGADDERAPLMGSVRRTRQSRRPNDGLRLHGEAPPTFMSRYGACIIITLVVLLVCMATSTFVVAMNRPLLDVSIKHIQNVLTSEQEIMLDLQVKATNPNLFTITVSDLDVNVFAESPYVGTAETWRRQHRSPVQYRGTWRNRPALEEPAATRWPWPSWPKDGVDEGTDPIDDPESGTQKMLLGCVFEFDSPLIFEASPLRRTPSSSVAEIRLDRPGNQTEEGGSARWERVMQHPFDLIVRGVIKYQLPLNSKVKSTKVASRVTVTPEDDSGDDDDEAGVLIVRS